MLLFEKIYTENHGWVKNYILQRLHCGNEAASDLTQNIFVKLARHLKNYDENSSSLNTFLNTITRTAIIDFHRKTLTENKIFAANIESRVNDNDENTFQIDSEFETDGELIGNELNVLIIKTLKGFNDNQRKVCELLIEGFKTAEIVEELSLPVGTVKVYILRFRNIMKMKLEKRNKLT